MTKIVKNTTANYALRLPRSLKTEVERLAAQDGVSVNQFIATAV
ncbi:MAG: toxin-antitoxin system HicB family antitoxin, partial [Chroococcidiopsis sp.]